MRERKNPPTMNVTRLICRKSAWLCNALGMDLSDVVARKMAKNELKYPAERVRGKYRLE